MGKPKNILSKDLLWSGVVTITENNPSSIITYPEKNKVTTIVQRGGYCIFINDYRNGTEIELGHAFMEMKKSRDRGNDSKKIFIDFWKLKDNYEEKNDKSNDISVEIEKANFSLKKNSQDINIFDLVKRII